MPHQPLAYLDPKFLESIDARPVRILSEYLEQANEALRRVFGTAALPENLPPSAVQAGGPAATPRR